MGSSGGGGTSTSTYSPPAIVSDAYKQLVPLAVAQSKQPYPEYGAGPAAAASQLNPYLVAPQTPNQVAAGQNIANLAGYYQPYANAASDLITQSANPIQMQQFGQQALNQYMSPYLNNVLGSTVANINETNAQQQQQLQSNAISRGAYGGDRGGIAQAELARQQNLANNATLANIANAGYSTALGEFNAQNQLGTNVQAQNRQLSQAAGANLANLGNMAQNAALNQANAQYQYGSAQQQQDQAAKSTAYQQFLNANQYPYQQLGWLGSIISGVASGSGGTGTSTAPGASAANQLLGGLGAGASILGNTGAFGSSGWLSSGLSGLFGGGAGAATLAGSPPFAPAALGFAVGVKTGGRIKAEDHPDHFDLGGIARDKQSDQLTGASPIAGIAAQQLVPNAPQMTPGSSKIPTPPTPRQPGIDPNALKSAVSGIKTMMGKNPDQQKQQTAPKQPSGDLSTVAAPPPPVPTDTTQAPVTQDDLSRLASFNDGNADGGRINHYGLGGVADVPNESNVATAPQAANPQLTNSLAALHQSQMDYTKSLPNAGSLAASSVQANPSMQPTDAFSAYNKLADTGKANLGDLQTAYQNYKNSFGNVTPTSYMPKTTDASKSTPVDTSSMNLIGYSADGQPIYGTMNSSAASTASDGGGGCCFNPDALVLMADKTWKKIKDIVEGDCVIGMNLKPNTVLGLKKTTVGNRSMKKFIDAGFYATDDHLFMTDNGWKTFNPQRLVDNNAENLVFVSESNKSHPISDNDRLLYVDILEQDFIPSFINYRDDIVQTFVFPEDYVVYDLHLDGDNTYVVDGFVVHNCGQANGGRIHGYASGGITNYGGMQTSKTLQDLAENVAGSGASSVPGTIEALASKDLLQESARGGVIRALKYGGDSGDGSDDSGILVSPPPSNYKDPGILVNPPSSQYANSDKGILVNPPKDTSIASVAASARNMPPELQRAATGTGSIPFDKSDLSPQALRSYGLAYAQSLGVDPKKVDHIMGHESGYKADAAGDEKSSFGPLQLHYGNVSGKYPHQGMGDAFTKDTGLDARDPSTAYEQIRYGINQMKDKGFGAWTTARDFAANALNGPSAGQQAGRQMQGAPEKKGSSNLFGMSDDTNYALLMASLRMMGTPGNVGMGLAAAGDTFAKTMAQQKQLNREQMSAEAEANLKNEQAASQRVSKSGYTTQVRTQNPDGSFRIENQVVAPGSTATFNTQGAQGGAGGQGGVGPQGSTGGGPQAPQGPQMPQQEIDALGPRAVGDTGENKFNVLQELGRQAIQANAGDEENAKKMFNEQYKDVYSSAKAAQGGRGDLAAVVKSVSELPSGGLTGFGPGSEARLNFARYINAGLRTFGDSGFDENNISNQQILQKVATLNANEGGNSIAARWLSQYANAFPNADQSETAAKNLTAQLLVANTRHQDAQRVADVYGRHSLRMGTELNNAMERVNPTELYAYAKNDIANLMIRRSVQDPVTGKLKNPVSALMAGDITPAEFNDYAKRNGSKIENLSHFVLGR